MMWLWGVYSFALVFSIWVGAAWPLLVAAVVHIGAAVRRKQDNKWQQRAGVQIGFANRLSAYSSAVGEHDRNVNHLVSELRGLVSILDDHQALWDQLFSLVVDLPPVRMCECGQDSKIRNVDALYLRVGQDQQEGRTVQAEMANTVATLTNSWADQKKRILENAQRGSDVNTAAAAAVEGRDRQAWEQAEQKMAGWRETGIGDATEGSAFHDAVNSYNRAVVWATNRLVPTVEVVYPCQECIRRQAEEVDRQQRERIAQAQLEQQKQVADQHLAEQRELFHQQERLAQQREEQHRALVDEMTLLRQIQTRREQRDREQRRNQRDRERRARGW